MFPARHINARNIESERFGLFTVNGKEMVHFMLAQNSCSKTWHSIKLNWQKENKTESLIRAKMFRVLIKPASWGDSKLWRVINNLRKTVKLLSQHLFLCCCKHMCGAGWDSNHIFARKISSNGFHLLELRVRAHTKHTRPQTRDWSYQSSYQGLIFHASCCLIQETKKALPRFPVFVVIGLPCLAVNSAQSTLREVFLFSAIQCLTRSGKLWVKSFSLPNDRAILFQRFPELKQLFLRPSV